MFYGSLICCLCGFQFSYTEHLFPSCLSGTEQMSHASPSEALHLDPFGPRWKAPEAQTTNDHHEARHEISVNEISRLHTHAIVHLYSVSETYRIWSRLELMSRSPSSVCHQFLQKSRLLLGYTRTEHPFQAEGEETYSCQAEKAHTTPLCSSCLSLRS